MTITTAPPVVALMCRHCGAWWDATDEMPCCLFPQPFDLNADAEPPTCPCGNDPEHAPGEDAATPAEDFVAHHSWATREHADYLAEINAADGGWPYCWVCHDWHRPEDEHSLTDD